MSAKTAVLLIEVNFDNLENRNPEYSTEIGLFTSKVKAEKWISLNSKPKYKGWDSNTYPIYKFKTIKLIS